MARYQVGNLVAYVNKFERCGTIASIDQRRGGKVGYRLNTGSDYIMAYENEIVLISTDAPIIPPKAAMKKIDTIEKGKSYYTPKLREALWKFINSGSRTATTFVNWVAEVTNRVIDELLDLISRSRIDLTKVSIENFISIKLFSIAV
ncbi:MAG: hypothetical protein HC838_12190 [Spirulinaceae cyanobacterium RM2_2_10]|nr:hypothetical protein [Spirulinaceae cyanobacterium SM2_1_0]NJO20636.1 hypothetical protein [Spirulinaceae cyanobacterium RM2_2_10]